MFTLAPNTWAAWQMIPGYGGQRCVPYFSPIRVLEVQPLKTNAGRLRLRFINMFYAEGVQNFDLELRVYQREANYLVAGIGNERVAVVSHIEFEWIRQFCPRLWCSHPPLSASSVSLYLDGVFGLGRGGSA